jgi:hypothetical protein
VPLGLVFFRAVVGMTGGSNEFAYPSWWSLAFLIPALVALVTLISAPLARQAASIKVSDALRFE